MKPRPIVFGEVLFDHFPDGSRRLGGAPLNVAAHLAALGAEPVLVSRVGDDAEGREVRREIAARGLDPAGLQVDAELPTGAVRVDLAGDEPRFTILEDRAWDRIDPAAAARAVAGAGEGGCLVYHGTLAARGERTREALGAVRDAARAPRFVDVNLRPPWTPRERALELARGATWLKVNRGELGVLRGGEIASGTALTAAARLAVRELELGALVVTDGERGAHLWLANGDEAHAASPALPPGRFADSVGAGDAMSAALVFGALAGWPPELALERGAALAAEICTVDGALPAAPDFYAPFLEAWEVGSASGREPDASSPARPGAGASA
jgi:fructokinase